MFKSLLLIAMFVLPTGYSFAEDLEESSAVGIRQTVYPCSSWSYQRFSNGQTGYVCSFRGSFMSLYDSYDVDRLVRNLETKITRLESRISDLEQKEKEEVKE